MDNQVNEPIKNYAQPLNFNTIWLMFKEVAESQKRTDTQIAKTEAQLHTSSPMY